MNLKEIDKLIQKYYRDMQLAMQRFANEVMKLKFKEIEDWKEQKQNETK